MALCVHNIRTYCLSNTPLHCCSLQITLVAMSPSEVVSLAKSPALEGRALSSLRSIAFGGAVIKPEIVDKFKERLPKGIKVLQGY